MDSLEYFLIFLMAPLILALSVLGNVLALVLLFKSKKLNNIDSVLVYKFLFISDTLYSIQIVQPYFQYAFNLNHTTF